MLTSADVPVSKVRTHSEQLSITSVLLLVEHSTGQLVNAPASLRKYAGYKIPAEDATGEAKTALHKEHLTRCAVVWRHAVRLLLNLSLPLFSLPRLSPPPSPTFSSISKTNRSLALLSRAANVTACFDFPTNMAPPHCLNSQRRNVL